MKFFRSGVILLVIAAVVGCSTLVRIETEPSGADVYVNDVKIGKSPVEQEYSNFVGNEYYVRIEKAGYRTIRAKMDKEFKVGAFIGGLFIWPIWLWVWGPSEIQYYDLERE